MFCAPVAVIDHDSARAALYTGRTGWRRAPADRAAGHVEANHAAIAQRDSCRTRPNQRGYRRTAHSNSNMASGKSLDPDGPTF